MVYTHVRVACTMHACTYIYIHTLQQKGCVVESERQRVIG